jgi:fatty-acyl-CoA synthase
VKPDDYKIWPREMPRSLSVPRTTLWFNVEVSATRSPERAAAIFYDSRLS